MVGANPVQLPLSSTNRSTPSPVYRLAAALVRAWRGHRSLMAWHRDLPRPPDCACVPERLWRRNSALLTLHSGDDGGLYP